MGHPFPVILGLDPRISAVHGIPAFAGMTARGGQAERPPQPRPCGAS